MNLYVLDQQFRTMDVIDSFESFIWADRYQKNGDFEIYCFPSENLLKYYNADNYIYNSDSEHLMIIEGLKTVTDIVDGDRIIVVGKSLESLLDRRIVWSQTTINGNLQNGIKKLIDENIISPTDPNRAISNFEFRETYDPRITELSVYAQYTGDTLYNVIQALCESNDIGFKITLENNNFIFQLYKGEDRAYSQTKNPYVVFSPKFDNIINSQYVNTTETYKNVALIAGEGEGVDRKTTSIGDTSGILRRELFVDARDISSTMDNNQTMSDADYTKLLEQRGTEKLSEAGIVHSFDAEVEASKTFVYGVDFNLGDTVQVENEYKLSGESIVSEIIWSYNKDGFRVYPTFVSKNK